ncbi:MAG: hypothetical protein RI886_942 [Pseudomonadota bacterium]|jgi:hypothetical protein
MAMHDAIKTLAEQLKKLINRFEEQKGIINTYIEKEREWKAIKIEQHNKIEALNRQIQELNENLNNEQ